MSSGHAPIIRFPHLNLWRNPFGEFDRQHRAVVACCDVSDELRWLQETCGAGQRVIEFIGPSGYGKTTHLLALMRQLPGSQYIYVPPERIVPPWRQGEHWLFVDEMDRAPWLQRWKLCRSGRLQAIATHRSLSREMSRHGIDLRTIEVSNRRDASRLLALLNRRIDASVFDRNAPAPKLEYGHAEYLVERFGDNIRSIEHFLYDVFQRLESQRVPEAFVGSMSESNCQSSDRPQAKR